MKMSLLILPVLAALALGSTAMARMGEAELYQKYGEENPNVGTGDMDFGGEDAVESGKEVARNQKAREFNYEEDYKKTFGKRDLEKAAREARESEEARIAHERSKAFNYDPSTTGIKKGSLAERRKMFEKK